ncbi:MAG: response regulator [Thermodesulfobacteriota bacterium]
MKNLMVVDDEPAQLKSLRVGLRSRGYRVREASNAVEALDFIEKEPNRVDLVITDYSMPSTDGLEFFEKLKTINRCLPLMMMTAYGEKDLILKALRSGCAGFIEKPFSLDELVEEIQRIEKNGLGKKPTPAESLDLAELVHQIKNPLMMIMGNAELTLLKEENPEVRKRMDGIMKAAQIIQELNSRILKKERSGLDIPEPVDVRRRMKECTRMFENIMALKGIHLEQASSEEPLWILGSRFGMDQVFRNLILNAIEAMESGSRKRLSIKIERTECVHIRIEDTGSGIPEESMETIFSPSYSTKEKGTGLGLYIVREIVNHHGGALSVQSKLGSGTVFHVRLPESINCKCKQECID